MKKILKQLLLVLVALAVMALAGCDGNKGSMQTAGEKVDRMSNQSEQSAIDNQFDLVEASLLALMQTISPAKSVVVEKNSSTIAEMRDGRKSREQRERESTSMRLAAIQRSLANISSTLSDAKVGVGENCHTEKVRVGWRCVRWGSTGNGGTAKCLEHEGIYEYRFVCK